MGVARGGPEAARMVVAGGDPEAANIIIVHSGEVLIYSPPLSLPRCARSGREAARMVWPAGIRRLLIISSSFGPTAY